MWHWPLPGIEWEDHPIGHHGAFGTRRKHDIHTGFDIYCEVGQEIEAVEDGVVVNIEHFTGPDAGSPWWNDTYAILIEGATGVVLYGELDPKVKIGDRVRSGHLIGTSLQVIKDWKKDRILPKTMLHVELHKHGTKACVWWPLDEDKPDHLLDPTQELSCAIDIRTGDISCFGLSVDKDGCLIQDLNEVKFPLSSEMSIALAKEILSKQK